MPTRQIASLRLVGWADLVVPERVTLSDQPNLAIRLAISCRIGTGVDRTRGIRAVRLGAIVEILPELRINVAADRGLAERRIGRDVGVELADPVDQAIAAGVRNHRIAARATIGDVFI